MHTSTENKEDVATAPTREAITLCLRRVQRGSRNCRSKNGNLTECTCLSGCSTPPEFVVNELLLFAQTYISVSEPKRDKILRERIVGSVGGGSTPIYNFGKFRICHNALRPFLGARNFPSGFLLQPPLVTSRMPMIRRLFSSVASSLAEVDDRVSSCISWTSVLSQYRREVGDDSTGISLDQLRSMYRRHLQCCIRSIVVVSTKRKPCRELLCGLSAAAFPATGDVLRFVSSVAECRVGEKRYDRVMLSPNLRYHAPAHGDGGLSFFVEMGVTGERLRKLIPVVDAFDVQLRSVLGGLLGPGTFQFKYQVGYMYTEYTWAQRAHIDFPYRQLALYPHQLFIGFFPLTSEGTFLQVWTSDFVGHLVFIPYGWFLVVPATTVHGGGFRSGASGNPRCHMYIYVGSAGCVLDHSNTYTTNTQPSRDLSDLYQDCGAVTHLFHSIFN